MKVHVAARNEEYSLRFLRNNPDTIDVVMHSGTKSLFNLLQSIIDGDDDYAIFVHDDVFLPSSINDFALKLIENLNTDWPNWGICGNAGIVVPTLTAGSRVCRYLFDPHGGPSIGGHVLPAETIDGNTILMNCRALRQAMVQLPMFEGFQFYDISLSVETLAAGLAVLVAPDLACFHNSAGNQSEFDRAFGSKAIIDYLSSKLSNRVVLSLNGVLKLPFSGKTPKQFDICNTAVKNASIGRPEARIAFVIRSQFSSPSLLMQAVTSAQAFAAATKNKSIKIYIITESVSQCSIKDMPDSTSKILKNIQIIEVLVDCLIEYVINSINENFVLFLDEGDWVFPTEADYIVNLLACLPNTAHLVVESQNFTEANTAPEKADRWHSSLIPQRRFLSGDWPLNFTGNDYVPMCGVFYSRTILLQSSNSVYKTMVYRRDYKHTLFALLNENSVFFTSPKLVIGSVVSSDTMYKYNNSDVGEEEIWNRSLAELAHHFCGDVSSYIAVSTKEKFINMFGVQEVESIAEDGFDDLTWLDRKTLSCSRIIQGAVAFVIHPDCYVSNLRKLILSTKSGGVRGGVQSIADMRHLFHR